MATRKSFNIADHEGASDTAAAEGVAADRFSRAREIVASQPSGISPSSAVTASPRAPQEGIADSTKVETSPENTLDNIFNARHTYSEKRIGELSASIAQRGQLSPALACTTVRLRELLAAEPSTSKAASLIRSALDGSRAAYMVIGGHYRKKAISRLPDPVIELKIVKISSLLDLYSLSYIENEEREDTSPLDDALSWQQLLETGVAKNHDEISRATQKPRTTIVKTLAILKLPATVLEIFKEAPERYSLTASYLMTQLADHLPPSGLDEIARKIIAGEFSTRDLEDRLKQLSANRTPRKPREISRQHKILNEGEEIGVIKEWDTGRVTLDVSLADQAEREALVAELRKRFGLEADAAQMNLRG